MLQKHRFMLQSSLVAYLKRQLSIAPLVTATNTCYSLKLSTTQQNQIPLQNGQQEEEQQDDGIDYDSSGTDPVNKWLPRQENPLQDENEK